MEEQKLTLMLSIRIDEDLKLQLERKHQLEKKEILSKHPGAKFHLADTARSVLKAGMGKQRNHRAALCDKEKTA